MTSCSVSRTDSPRAIDVAGEVALILLLLERQQRARVAHGEPSRGHLVLHVLRQLEQPEQVRHRRPVLADRRRDFLLRQVELVRQPFEPEGFLDRVEVFALDVLDERPLEQFLLLARRHVAYGDGHFQQARALRGAPAALAGDDFVRRRPARRTTIGWMRPFDLIERASSSMRASSACARGW